MGKIKSFKIFEEQIFDKDSCSIEDHEEEVEKAILYTQVAANNFFNSSGATLAEGLAMDMAKNEEERKRIENEITEMGKAISEENGKSDEEKDPNKIVSFKMRMAQLLSDLAQKIREESDLLKKEEAAGGQQGANIP